VQPCGRKIQGFRSDRRLAVPLEIGGERCEARLDGLRALAVVDDRVAAFVEFRPSGLLQLHRSQ
jgi:hypothetical protein